MALISSSTPFGLYILVIFSIWSSSFHKFYFGLYIFRLAVILVHVDISPIEKLFLNKKCSPLATQVLSIGEMMSRTKMTKNLKIQDQNENYENWRTKLQKQDQGTKKKLFLSKKVKNYMEKHILPGSKQLRKIGDAHH